ncbi:MAG: citrate (Si)-synthase [Deltaproteobacteria bacterium]|nr:citrate (Si)-synthase [Deltaproteobacteria bacterium]
MAASTETKNIGLRGIVVADSRISDVNGKIGKLIYRGYDAVELSRFSTYEEVAHLLLYGKLPGPGALERFDQQLREHRRLPDLMVDHLKSRPATAPPMEVLQTMVSMMPDFDPDSQVETHEANEKKAIRLIAQIPTVVAYWHRIRSGLEIVPPSSSLSHGADFLAMLNGTPPDADTAREFDVFLILHAEHSFNASTFAGRQIASTRATMYAAVVAALGALSGELHGGANIQVMRMLTEIGSPEKAADWVRERLAGGEKIMGMGHAVYRTQDPRAVVIKEFAKRISERAGDFRLLEISREVENTFMQEVTRKKKRGIYPNVDFYSPIVFHLMGIPTDLFTAVFAISRISGWCAHVLEEKFAEAQPKPALYRPESEYIGRYCGPEACEYIPMDRR